LLRCRFVEQHNTGEVLEFGRGALRFPATALRLSAVRGIAAPLGCCGVGPLHPVGPLSDGARPWGRLFGSHLLDAGQRKQTPFSAVIEILTSIASQERGHDQDVQDVGCGRRSRSIGFIGQRCPFERRATAWP